MLTRYRAGVALTSLLLLFTGQASAKPHPSPSPKPAVAPESLYSPRALRMTRTILQLRLLELRRERLERLERALERREPIDQIMREDAANPPR